MSGRRARTIPELGRDLATDPVSTCAKALGCVRTIVGVTAMERGSAVETLIDRYSVSMQLLRPVGLDAWAERHAEPLGDEGVVEVIAGVTSAIARRAEADSAVDQGELWRFLRRLEGVLFRHARRHDESHI